MTKPLTPYVLDDTILTVRGQRVLLDVDLAHIYGVEVKRLNEQVKRNRLRFPQDFAFQLTPQEVIDLKSQIATSSSFSMRSQIATASAHGGRRTLFHAFTEHGAIMAAMVLNSSRAVEMSVFVVRAFIKMREQLLTTVTLAQRLAEVEKLLLTHNSSLRMLYQQIRPLLLAPPEPVRPKIGFDVHEPRATYHTRRPRTR